MSSFSSQLPLWFHLVLAVGATFLASVAIGVLTSKDLPRFLGQAATAFVEGWRRGWWRHF